VRRRAERVAAEAASIAASLADAATTDRIAAAAAAREAAAGRETEAAGEGEDATVPVQGVSVPVWAIDASDPCGAGTDTVARFAATALDSCLAEACATVTARLAAGSQGLSKALRLDLRGPAAAQHNGRLALKLGAAESKARPPPAAAAVVGALQALVMRQASAVEAAPLPSDAAAVREDAVPFSNRRLASLRMAVPPAPAVDTETPLDAWPAPSTASSAPVAASLAESLRPARRTAAASVASRPDPGSHPRE